MVVRLAWRNLWRQTHRTALSLTSIALASGITVFLLSLQQGAYGTIWDSVLRLTDGFAQVRPADSGDDPDLRRTIDGPSRLVDLLDRLPGITAATPRATSFAILSHGPRSYGGAVLGVDPQRESKVSVLGTTIATGRYLTAQDSNAAVIGAGLSRVLDLSVGDALTLLGTSRDGSIAADQLTVIGIFATGAPELDRRVVEIPLRRFQDDFALGDRASLVVIGGRTLRDVEAVLPRLQTVVRPAGLVVRDAAQLEPGLNEVILLDISFSLLLYISTVVAVVFIILNTILMSVLERTREFGMLMALGMRPAMLGRMVWTELLFLAVIGGAIGIAVGSLGTAWAATHGVPLPRAEALFAQWHMPSLIHPRLSILSALAGPMAIMAAIAAVGFVPLMNIRRLEPVSAMRAA